MKLDKKNIGKKQVNKLWSLKCQETEVQMYWTDGFQTRLQSAWKHRKRRQTGTDDQKLRESKERCETQRTPSSKYGYKYIVRSCRKNLLKKIYIYI